MSKPLNVGIYIFENMTMLDGYAPLQILSFVEQFNTFTFANTTAAVPSDCGALLTPEYGLENCPPLDILVMPGGGDILPQMQDQVLQTWLRENGPRTDYITSVCTGALILAEAGLLDGHRATTHWGWLTQLRDFPQIEVVDERVVVDRTRISGGGVTAGIDFALTLIAEVVGQPAAEALQLVFAYQPDPPFNSGAPDNASSEILAQVEQMVKTQKGELVDHTAAKRTP